MFIYHLKPTESKDHAVLASIVHIARGLSIANQADESVEIQDLHVRTEVWESLGLTPDECGKLCEGVEEKVGEISGQIFPKAKIAQGSNR